MQFKRVCSPGEGVTGLGGRFFEKGWTVRESGKQTPRYEIEVPGNVRLALMKAGIILDPFILQQNEQSKWVSTVAWEYENNLDYSNWETELLNKIPMGGLVHLVFDAIDYDATFILNHEKICRQVGMFSPIDIITGITPEQKSNQNQVPIKVHFNVQPFWRQHAVKSQMAFGWDFAPEIRTVGIWKNVRMHYTGAAFFTEAYAIAAPINPKNVENCQAKLKLNICIDCIDPASLTPVKGAQSAEIQLKTDFFEQSLPINFTPGSPISIDCGEVEIPLWSPWSLGKPIIIPITVSLLWNGNVSDEYRGTIMNRQIKWLRNPGSFPGNENWTLSINSKPIFVRGIKDRKSVV